MDPDPADRLIGVDIPSGALCTSRRPPGAGGRALYVILQPIRKRCRSSTRPLEMPKKQLVTVDHPA
jgi:hypothetical protein